MARRSGWYQVKGKWTRTLGERGCRVRLFEMTKGGQFYRTVWVPGRGKDRRCLFTSDKQEAERLGRALLAELLSGIRPAAPAAPLTLGELWRRFRTECPAFLDNVEDSRGDAGGRAALLLAHFGERCAVRDLTAADQAAYSAARRAGRIQRADGRTTRPVRARSVEADLVLLHQMLAWAVTVRVNGVRLLDAHPLAGVRRVREANPRRPVATWERFNATRSAMRQLAAAATTDAERLRWTKLEFVLVLAEATGRRVGSNRLLRWEDIDWERSTIRWRAEADKKRREAVVPIPAALLDECRHARRELAAVGGWCFPAEQDPSTPMDRHLFKKWLRVAEAKAKLPKLDGGLWHPYRRKWATERKGLPLTDVAAAGGWRDVGTLLECYQQPTNDVLLAVMSEPKKVRDVAIVSGG